MKENKHDLTILYLEELIKKEFKHRINKDYALLRDRFEYDIYINNKKIHGECDLFYVDFDIMAAYAFEVKHDEKNSAYLKAKQQLEKDFRMFDSFYNWILKDGFYVWYYPKKGGEKILQETNPELLFSNSREKYLKEMLFSYEHFFDELLKNLK